MRVCKTTLLLLALFIATLSAQAQVPRYNSYLSASAVIFLDFDGHYVNASAWNWNGPIDAQPSGLSSEDIRAVFNRVSEDYRPFNVNVTTDSTVFLQAPYNQRIRVIVTVTSQWYGAVCGISYVGSFVWGDDTPAFVFSDVLGYNSKFIGEASSHEAGHTLGLQHQSRFDVNCAKTEEYSTGDGDGEIGWAPIMGLGYYKNFTTWHDGPNTFGCTSFQNDLEIIAGSENNFGYRTDDRGNTMATATTIDLEVPYIYLNGIIGEPGDVDVYSINLLQQNRLSINIVPQNVGNNNDGANLDVKAYLLNAVGDTNAVYDPPLKLEANIDTVLNTGKYYLVIKATGNSYNTGYGSMGLYYISGMTNRILPMQSFVLKAGASNGQDILQWTYLSDEKVSSIVVETSQDGLHFTTLASLPANLKSYSSKHVAAMDYYRLKALMVGGDKIYYSNIINSGKLHDSRYFKLQSNVIKSTISISSQGVYSYQVLDGAGRVVQKGNISKGFNTINAGRISKGIFYLRVHNGTADWTEKLIKQ